MRNQEANRGRSRPAVYDVTDADFGELVLQRSRSVPVVVDFWALWCQPCRTLGPMLERLAEDADGAWVLAKVDTDANPSLVREYGIQGIPAVKAFRDGAVVAQFVGVQPEPTLRQFLEGLGPSESDRLVAAGRSKEVAGEVLDAERLYMQALERNAAHPGALVGVGRLLAARDRFDEAEARLSAVPRGRPERAEAESWLAQIRFRRESQLSGGEIAARRRIAANPDDVDARLQLASALAAKREYREALEGLLSIAARADDRDRERARQGMLAVFALLGDDDPLVSEYRGRLALLLW